MPKSTFSSSSMMCSAVCWHWTNSHRTSITRSWRPLRRNVYRLIRKLRLRLWMSQLQRAYPWSSLPSSEPRQRSAKSSWPNCSSKCAIKKFSKRSSTSHSRRYGVWQISRRRTKQSRLRQSATQSKPQAQTECKTGTLKKKRKLRKCLLVG